MVEKNDRTKQAGSYRAHQNTINRCLELAQAEFPTVRFFKRFNGQLYTIDGKPVKVGVNGQADVYALAPSLIGPITIEFEFKTGNARQSESQKNYEKLILSMGGQNYAVVRTYDDMKNLLNFCLANIKKVSEYFQKEIGEMK